MTDVIRCDGPGCGRVGEWPPPSGWMLLEPLDADEDEPQSLHFCSVGCLGGWVMEQAGTLDRLRQGE